MTIKLDKNNIEIYEKFKKVRNSVQNILGKKDQLLKEIIELEEHVNYSTASTQEKAYIDSIKSNMAIVEQINLSDDPWT